MSKLTAKKIKKCREFIKSRKGYKRFVDKVYNREHSYSELNKSNHILGYKFWLNGN